MSDITELCRAMRGVNNVVDQRAAADAIESQAREIEELTERVTTLGAAVIAPVDGESVLGKLGSKLADLLDENDWASVEPYLNRALLENYGLRTRAEAAEKDAARYRWLRSQPTAAMHEEGWQIRRHWRERGREHAGQPTPGLDSCCFSGRSLDAAIDAAIAAGGSGDE